MPTPTSRRDFLASTAALAGAALAAPAPARGRAPADPPADGRVVVAHLTDIHVQPENRAREGLAACLEHVHALPRRPDLILGGGDVVMDVMDNGRARADELRTCCIEGFRDCRIPVRHCIGNHDIFGWNRTKSGTSGEEADWGKRWAMDLFGLERPHYSFDHGAWHFVVLDGVQPNGAGYLARLDDEQLEWLAADLAAQPAGRPTLVLSHIPIVTVTGFTADRNAGKSGETVISRSEMHSDAPRIHRILAESGRVRLCLSGHMHLLDRVEVDGVTYVCDGAVSGGWWRGPHAPRDTAAKCENGYGLVTLAPDGTFGWEYRTYGWTA